MATKRQDLIPEKGERLTRPDPEGGYDIVQEDGHGGHMYKLGALPHRLDGPANTWMDGTEFWYFQGQLHRGGGKPAIIYPDGRREFYINGVRTGGDPRPERFPDVREGEE
jgi:hypothetical protein